MTGYLKADLNRMVFIPMAEIPLEKGLLISNGGVFAIKESFHINLYLALLMRKNTELAINTSTTILQKNNFNAEFVSLLGIKVKTKFYEINFQNGKINFAWFASKSSEHEGWFNRNYSYSVAKICLLGDIMIFNPKITLSSGILFHRISAHYFSKHIKNLSSIIGGIQIEILPEVKFLIETFSSPRIKLEVIPYAIPESEQYKVIFSSERFVGMSTRVYVNKMISVDAGVEYQMWQKLADVNIFTNINLLLQFK